MPFQPETKLNVACSKCIGRLILLILVVIIIIALIRKYPIKSEFAPNQHHNTLIFVQVLFRHGERTPVNVPEEYQHDPYINYTYEPYGPGALTNKGKRTELELGKHLRNHYGNFLREYHRDIVYAKTSTASRCRASLLLVLAGLFPPSNNDALEDNLVWQPIPYDYTRMDLDYTFLYFFNCKKYIVLERHQYGKAIENNEVKSFKELSKKFEIYAGSELKTYRSIFNLYSHLQGQKHFGLKLPEWANEFLTIPIEDYESLIYTVSTRTEEVKRLSGGFILGEIIDNMLSKRDDPNMKNRKIHLYSGHDLTIAHLMGTLGFTVTKMVPYGSYLSFELHKIEGNYTLKLLLNEGSTNVQKVLKLQGCEEMCPLQKFLTLYSKYVATPDMCKPNNQKVTKIN